MTTRSEAFAERSRKYLPAAGHDWFLPLYDPFVKLFGGDRARRVLLDQAVIEPGQKVLDIGCGTGTFLLLLAENHPGVKMAGLDPDPKALGQAARKGEQRGAAIRLDRGFADQLPYPDAAFDQVFSCFMFHHLPANEKEPTLREVRRVLKPSGSFHMLDFAGAGHSHGLLMRLTHASDRLKDNAEDHVVDLLRRAGFTRADITAHGAILFGRLAYYTAST